MKNLLITGGLGYIGSKFIENFSDLYNIFVLDTRLYNDKNTEKYNLIKKDIRELIQMILKILTMLFIWLNCLTILLGN